jgi:hypothetical protein
MHLDATLAVPVIHRVQPLTEAAGRYDDLHDAESRARWFWNLSGLCSETRYRVDFRVQLAGVSDVEDDVVAAVDKAVR